MGSPLFHEILQFLAAQGKIPQYARIPSPRGYGVFPVKGRREWTKAEMDSAQFLHVFSSKETLYYGVRNAAGIIEAERKHVRKQRLGSSGGMYAAMFCVDSMRKELEAEGFAGMVFKPVVINGKLPPLEPIWELAAERAMPPLKNRLVHADGTEHRLGKSGQYVLDDSFSLHLYSYNAADVEAVGDVDVVRTVEIFGIERVFEPHLFFSQRLRRWCDKKNQLFEYAPIALE